ncbi:MAG: hypothetical protein OD918_00035 [Gammaproteobacteria bacterium]
MMRAFRQFAGKCAAQYAAIATRTMRKFDALRTVITESGMLRLNRYKVRQIDFEKFLQLPARRRFGCA